MNKEESEIHAKEFLDFIANNQELIRKNLRKNITYNEDLFEDVISESIIKVYDYIIRKKKKIDDFEQFFFIVSKRLYILKDNKNRTEIINNDREVFPEIIDEPYDKTEERIHNVEKLYKFIFDRLEENFEEWKVDIYIIYFKLKSEKNSISYKKLSEITGLDFKTISTTIQTLKKFVKCNEEIRNKKKELGL